MFAEARLPAVRNCFASVPSEKMRAGGCLIDVVRVVAINAGQRATGAH
jgi:hypothetical protein